jgi:AcrR family transcriptional regulator
MSRKIIEYEARQQFILNAARQLYSEKGVENANMDDIASAAEYTRRTLYSYFKSRDEISLMVLIEDLNTRWEKQKKAIAQVNTGLEKILTWGESLFEFSREYPQSIRLQLYWDLKGIDRNRISDSTFDSFEEINNELAEGLRKIFKIGIADRSLRQDLKIDICISQFLYSIRAVINRAISQTYSFAQFNTEEYFRHYLDLFARGIRNN